jgi:hypothetical protein
MQVKYRYWLALGLLTLLVLAVRLSIAFSVEAPSYTSYFTVMQAEEILHKGTPLFEDPLTQRNHAFNPLFYYVVACFLFFVPETLLLKLLPNIAMVALIPLVYFISFNITKSRGVSLISAFFAAFAPILFTSFLNEATPLSFTLPMLAALLLALLEIEKYPITCLLFTILLTLLSPLVWLMLAAYILYVLILTSEQLAVKAPYMEMALLTFLFASWYTLVTYKEALFREGFAILYGSVPQTVRAAMFSEFTLLAMIYAVGVLPLAFGSYALYHNAFEQRVRKIFLIGAFTLAALAAALLQLIPLTVALLLLSLGFILLSAPALHTMLLFLKKTRLPSATPVILTVIVAFFILTSLLPALSTGIWPQSSPTQDELTAVAWLRGESKEEATILFRPKNGFSYQSTRRTSSSDRHRIFVDHQC